MDIRIIEDLTNKYGSIEKAKVLSRRDLIKLMLFGDDAFLKNMNKSESLVYTASIEILNRMPRDSKGKILKEDDNQKILLELNNSLVTAMKTAKLKSFTSKLLSDVSKTEELTKENLALTSPEIDIDPWKINVSPEKQMIAEWLSSELASSAGYRRLALPIKKILYRHATSGITFKDAQAELESFILGEGKGFLYKRVHQIARDTLNQFSGAIQAKAVQEFNLTHFLWDGGIIKTSRQNCIDLVNGEGVGKFINERGYYRIADIPKIIELARGGNGWNNKVVDTYTFFIYRMGYACRHLAMATVDVLDPSLS